MTEMISEKKKGYEWTVLSVTTVGALLASIQSSALLIALPNIMTSLNADFLTVLWVLLSYLLITTAMLPIVGRLADMFGRKRLYILGFVVFTIGSLLCGLASPTFQGWDLVGYRIVQGVGGALIIANSTAMVADAFDHRRLGLGLGVNQIAGAAGLVLGPVIGGLLMPFGWEWVFLFNVPFGIFGAVWGYMRLREPVNLPKGQSFDWPGAATFAIGMTALLLAASLIAFPILSMEIVYALFAVGIIGLGIFLYLETKTDHPMIDLKLFRIRDFALGNLNNLLLGLARGALLFLIIFFLQGPYGMDPLTAGLSLIPFGLSFMIVGPISGHLSDRHGARKLVLLGAALTALALFGFALIDHNTPFWWLVALMVLAGVASGLFISPNSKTVMNSVKPERRGIAAGTRMMLSNAGSTFALAIAFPLVLANIPHDQMLKLFLYGGGISPETMMTFENGLHTAFLVFFVISLLAVVVTAFNLKENPSEKKR
jgi:EmrB/QacA subfamily drug resistance transporter